MEGKEIKRNYVLLENIYQNRQSKITRVKDENGVIYIRKDVYERLFSQNPFFKAYFQTEKRIMSLQGDYLVSMYDQWKENNYYSIIMQNCDLGDLNYYVMKKYNNQVPHQIIPEIFVQVLCGLGQIHKYNILHRDLKPENIFLKTEGDQVVVKLGDFGTSKIVSELTTTRLGTNGYMAPQFYENMPYTSKVDVWALGIVLYKLYSQMRQPFGRYEGQKDQDYYQRMKNSTIKGPVFRIPQQYSDNAMTKQAKKLIKEMLKYKPQDRIDWPDILKSRYLKLFKESSINNIKYQRLLTKLLSIEEHYQKRKKKTKLIQIENIKINILKEQILKPLQQMLKADKKHKNICQFLLIIFLGIRRILLMLCQSKEDRIQFGLYNTKQYQLELQLIHQKENFLFKIQFSNLEINKTEFALSKQMLHNNYFITKLEESVRLLQQYQNQASQKIIQAIDRYLKLERQEIIQSSIVFYSSLFQSQLRT